MSEKYANGDKQNHSLSWWNMVKKIYCTLRKYILTLCVCVCMCVCVNLCTSTCKFLLGCITCNTLGYLRSDKVISQPICALSRLWQICMCVFLLGCTVARRSGLWVIWGKGEDRGHFVPGHMNRQTEWEKRGETDSVRERERERGGGGGGGGGGERCRDLARTCPTCLLDR